MYLASSFDGALRVYDVSIGSDGAPRNALLAAIPVGRSANAVRVAGLRPDEHRASMQAQGSAERVVDARGGGLIYVTALEDGVVVVIDPQRLAVIARIKVGASPHDVAFLPTDEGGLNAYVTNFKAHSVSVIDVTEGSETRFQVTHTIGGEGS
jgi:YVTN family beta-propeller protein